MTTNSPVKHQYCCLFTSRHTLIFVERLRRLNMVCMSMRDCRTSRYTEPRKLSGKESWNSSPFTITRSPTVIVPAHCIERDSKISACSVLNNSWQRNCLHKMKCIKIKMSHSWTNLLSMFVNVGAKQIYCISLSLPLF